ncbi:MAG: Panacea domain-containing protein [Candidatus Krumholzibacteriia bacterium]
MPLFDEDKTLNSILYLSQKAAKGLDLYALVKMIYFADKAHLLQWGRTITGNSYTRMQHGPTPSEAYDMLKSARDEGDWRWDLKKYFAIERNNKVVPKRKPDMSVFSASEVEILDTIYKENTGKTFDQLKRKAHDKAYRSSKVLWMTYEDMAEGDAALIEHIRKSREDNQVLDRC